MCVRLYLFFFLLYWADCHEHPELREVQYGERCSWDPKESDR